MIKHSGPWMIELEQRSIELYAAIRDGPVGGVCRCWKKDLPLITARQRMTKRLHGTGYRLSQCARKGVEEGIGWCKAVAGLTRARHMGRWKITSNCNSPRRPTTSCGCGSC